MTIGLFFLFFLFTTSLHTFLLCLDIYTKMLPIWQVLSSHTCFCYEVQVEMHPIVTSFVPWNK